MMKYLMIAMLVCVLTSVLSYHYQAYQMRKEVAQIQNTMSLVSVQLGGLQCVVMRPEKRYPFADRFTINTQLTTDTVEF